MAREWAKVGYSTFYLEIYCIKNNKPVFLFESTYSIYSLKDCSTFLRTKLDAKGKRIIWVDTDLALWTLLTNERYL